MKIAHHQECKDEAGDVQRFLCHRSDHRMKQSHDYLVERVLTCPAQSQAGQSYSHLRHRQQTLWISEQVERRLRTRLSTLGELAQSRFADRHERHLGGCKESIHRDDENQDNDPKAVMRISHRNTVEVSVSGAYGSSTIPECASIGSSNISTSRSRWLCWLSH